MKSEGLCNIQYVLMLLFHNSILLRSFNTTELMQDASFNKKILHDKFSTIITFDAFHFSIKLCLNHCRKLLQSRLCIWFVLQQIHPSAPRTIIYNSQEVFETINCRNSERTPYINESNRNMLLIHENLKENAVSFA